MRATSGKNIRGTLFGGSAIVLIACAVLLRLVWISEPGKAASVQFQGFVLLPKGALLTVLDYLTVSGQLLFVTDESTGSVYKVALHERALPQSSDVSVFSAEPAAHGVVLDPQRRLAYVTRSEVDAVDVFDPSNGRCRTASRSPVRTSAAARAEKMRSGGFCNTAFGRLSRRASAKYSTRTR
jgi:hypothetical protein